MAFDNSGFLFVALTFLYIYLVSKEWEQLDNKHLALREKRKNIEPNRVKEEDGLIFRKALRNKARAIVDYRNKYHISLSCAQEIVEEILKEETKAQSL